MHVFSTCAFVHVCFLFSLRWLYWLLCHLMYCVCVFCDMRFLDCGLLQVGWCAWQAEPVMSHEAKNCSRIAGFKSYSENFLQKVDPCMFWVPVSWNVPLAAQIFHRLDRSKRRNAVVESVPVQAISNFLVNLFLRVFKYTSQATRRNARVFLVCSCRVSVRFGQGSVLAFWDLNRCSGYFGTVHYEKPRCPTKKNVC